MVSTPALIPVTIPTESIVAWLLLVLHVPPEVLSVRVIEELVATMEEPEIAATEGKGLMVIAFVAVSTLVV